MGKSNYRLYLLWQRESSSLESSYSKDNILYKGYVLSDYNKHKQRTAVRHLREYIAQAIEDSRLESQILEVGDGLAISRVKK